jgi:hypothetical protein
MLLAIMAYLIYNNLVTISQGWVANGKLSFVGRRHWRPSCSCFASCRSCSTIVLPCFLVPAAVAMKIYQRYLAREVSAAILLVLLAFLALFAFFRHARRSQEFWAGRVPDPAMLLGMSCCACRGVPMN